MSHDSCDLPLSLCDLGLLECDQKWHWAELTLSCMVAPGLKRPVRITVPKNNNGENDDQ
jgi:hypothetical protein